MHNESRSSYFAIHWKQHRPTLHDNVDLRQDCLALFSMLVFRSGYSRKPQIFIKVDK